MIRSALLVLCLSSCAFVEIHVEGDVSLKDVTVTTTDTITTDAKFPLPIP